MVKMPSDFILKLADIEYDAINISVYLPKLVRYV